MVDQAGRDLHDMPRTPLCHLGNGAPGETEEPAEVDRNDGGEIVLGVVDERFGDEDACIVDERVDAAEAIESLRDDALHRRRIDDVAGDVENVRVGRRLDRARIGDHAVVPLAKSPDQIRANPLRRAGDDRDLPVRAHDISMVFE